MRSGLPPRPRDWLFHRLRRPYLRDHLQLSFLGVLVTNVSGIRPIEYQVLVELDPVETKTAGGIILPDNVKDKDELASEEGTLVALSPLAFNYDEGYPEDAKPKVGDRVMFKRYDGLLRKRTIDGVERSFRILVDKSIVAVIDEPRVVVEVRDRSGNLLEEFVAAAKNATNLPIVTVRGEPLDISEFDIRVRPVDGQGAFSDERV